MNSTDLDLDAQMITVEHEWRRAYEASIAARADYQRQAAAAGATADTLDLLRERLDRAEALKGRIMARLELLEDALLARG